MRAGACALGVQAQQGSAPRPLAAPQHLAVPLLARKEVEYYARKGNASQRVCAMQSDHALCCAFILQAENFSLGGAMLGAPAADGYANSSQQAPDAWLLCFAKHHADAAVYSGLFRSCRGGRDLALRYARKAALQLLVADSKPDGVWRRHLAAVRRALGVRGALPTSLQIRRLADERVAEPGTEPGQQQSVPAGYLARLAMVPKQLTGVGMGITNLDLDVWEGLVPAGR